MPGLRAAPRRDESGAVAIVIAVLMASVLLGLGAVVLDIGSLYGERRQLQNGADAAAVAVAQGCAPPAACDSLTSNGGTAGKYAGDNDFHDGKAGIDLVCGTAPGLGGCPAKQGAWDCVPPPSSGALAGAPYVQVQTSTLTASGSTLLPPILARALSGNSSYNGSTVRACARASFGAASALAALPLTVSDCTFIKALPLKPAPPPVSTPSLYYVHDSTNKGADACTDPHSGNAIPGGFGYLSTTSGQCLAQSDTANWFPDSTGNSPPNPCSDADFQALLGTIVDVPIYDNVNGLPGSNGKYQILGYAGFYFTGYQLGGSFKQKDIVTHTYPCSPPDTCVSGFFTSNPRPRAGIVGGPPGSTGVVVVQISG